MKNKVILDEMQQKTLLEIEHKTLHIALTGLLVVILIQQIFWKDRTKHPGRSSSPADFLRLPAAVLHQKRNLGPHQTLQRKKQPDHQPAGQSGNGYLLGSDQPAALP